MTITVRFATHSDVPAIVAVHLRAFPEFFLSSLGRSFLSVFYASFIDDQDRGILIIGELQNAGIVALLAGTSCPDRFFADLRRRRGARLFVAALPALAAHPLRVAERLLAGFLYRGDQSPELPGFWLLSSLGVDPHHGRSGLGAALVQRFCEIAAARSARGVYLLTDSKDNDRTLRFYGGCGFVKHASFTRRDGRSMYIMTRSFSDE